MNDVCWKFPIFEVIVAKIRSARKQMVFNIAEWFEKIRVVRVFVHAQGGVTNIMNMLPRDVVHIGCDSESIERVGWTPDGIRPTILGQYHF